MCLPRDLKNMVGWTPQSMAEKSQENHKMDNDLEDIFFESDTINHLSSDSYQTLCMIM